MSAHTAWLKQGCGQGSAGRQIKAMPCYRHNKHSVPGPRSANINDEIVQTVSPPADEILKSCVRIERALPGRFSCHRTMTKSWNVPAEN